MTEPVTTMWGLIEAAATDHPDRVLFADDHGRTLTAAQLRDAAERVAAGLRVRPGQVVSWQLPTVLEAPVLLAALARVGAVQNPLIAILREREIGLIARQVRPSLIVVPRIWRGYPHAERAEGLGAEVMALDLADAPSADAGLRLPMGDPATLPPPPADAGEVRWLYYSSGTTADPKGARHTDSSVISSSHAVTDALGLAYGDTYPIAWAYPHIGGATMTVAVLRRGARLVLFDSFDPERTPHRMAAHRPTVLGSATPFFRAYLDAQQRHGEAPLFPALRALTNGGAPIPPDLIAELFATFGPKAISNQWGLTEFACATALAVDDPVEKVATTVGRPARGVRVRIVDGELRLKGPHACAGYVDTALDVAAFDEEGWFRTGDLGTVDADGFVTVTGRLKEIIIRNAENISALEVENALRRHPDIVDATVIGLPDPRAGERVCAVVVTRSGAHLTLDEVARHCRAEGLARQKTPEQVETVDALPRNAMGKVLKPQLRTRFGHLGTPAP